MSQNSSIIFDVTERLTREVRQVVLGHDRALRYISAVFMAGGHVLLEGPPGIAKTRLARSFADAIGLSFKRIQFTPDLMPSDVTGVTMFDQKTAKFFFVPGPVFTDVLLADEINRTPPKTQAALLEAMEERQVSVDGETRRLNPLFFAIATQNPIEHEGTFPLPEAQLDRFMVKLRLSYPDRAIEQEMILSQSSSEQSQHVIRAVVSESELQQARAAVRAIHLSPELAKYISELLNRTRNDTQLLLGASPRAGLQLALLAKSLAGLDSRDYVIAEDIQEAFEPVLNHRIIPRAESYSGSPEAEAILGRILSETPLH
jgi:MoxR-like ATPase